MSRITEGAKSNHLGQIAQKFVYDYLSQTFAQSPLLIQLGGRLPGVKHTATASSSFTSFDLTLTNGHLYLAIEICFQVTTNSVIERKAGQAKSRYEQIQQAGHRIAYILDGAGNFQREQALRTICAYSDCTLAFSRAELAILSQFIQEIFDL